MGSDFALQKKVHPGSEGTFSLGKRTCSTLCQGLEATTVSRKSSGIHEKSPRDDARAFGDLRILTRAKQQAA